MPEPLDLEAIKRRAETAAVSQRNHELLGVGEIDADGALESGDFNPDALVRFDSAADVPALIAEIERLRAIAAPLERLEAWRLAARKPQACVDIHSDKPGVTVELDDGAGDDWGRIAMANASTLPLAIAAALDNWDRQHGKDGA